MHPRSKYCVVPVLRFFGYRPFAAGTRVVVDFQIAALLSVCIANVKFVALAMILVSVK